MNWPRPRRSRAQADTIRLAVHRHEPGLGLCDRIEPEPIAQLSVASVSRHRSVDQPGIGSRDGRVIQPEPRHHAGGEILQYNVGTIDDLARDPPPLLLLQIERDAFLTAIGPQIRRALLLRHHWAYPPEIVAAVGLFDFDDLGTEIGEEHGAERPSDEVAEIGDSDAGEGERCRLRPRSRWNQFRSFGLWRHNLLPHLASLWSACRRTAAHLIDPRRAPPTVRARDR